MKKTRHGDWEKVLTFPVYSKYQVHIIFSDDIEKSYTSRYGKPRNGTLHCDAFHRNSVNGHGHMFFGHKVSIGTIAHEAYHAVYAMMEYVNTDIDDNENVAYHLGFIVDETVEFERLKDMARGAGGWVNLNNFEAVKSSTQKVKDDQVETTRGTPTGLQGLRNSETPETLLEGQDGEARVSGTDSGYSRPPTTCC